MRAEDKQQYLDMLPRVFVRALRDTENVNTAEIEFSLSEGEATDLLRRREEFNGGALFDALHLARNAIASLSPDALGWGGVDAYPDPPYPIRDELLMTIDQALSSCSTPASVDEGKI